MTYMTNGFTPAMAIDKAISIAHPPHCPACGEKMRLQRIAPTRAAKPAHRAEQITYECGCGLILAQTVETPS